MSAHGGEARYIRAVEAAWSKLRARPTVLSPRDFEIVDGWRRREIPLAVVLEVFEHRAKRRASGGGRSLSHLASAVEEAWAAVAAGRAVSAPPPPETPSADAGETWCVAFSKLPDGAPLKAILTQLAHEAGAGVPPDVLDVRLDGALPWVAPADLVARAERETTLALAAFRTRMRRDEFEKTFARAVSDRLREALSLPRLPRAG